MLLNRITSTLALLSLASTVMAAPLPPLNIDRSGTTVSGVSSGGYMAVQLHVAYSAVFKKGAGVIAGGPFNCAESGVLNAIGRCLGKADIPVDALVKITNEWASAGQIDATANLSASRVYIFAGSKDTVVNPATSTALQAYYQRFMPAANVVLKNNVEAEHAVVTDDYGPSCATKATPFINNCGFDMAGAMLQHLYGPLTARSKEQSPSSLLSFEQTAFVTGHGMADTGWVYIPKACIEGAKCRVHVALHGCKQNATDVGQEFVRNAGYNRWAESNNLVILYPQTGGKAINGCWDWWGYDDASYAKKSAPQMAAIVAMIEQLAKSSAVPAFTATPPAAR